MPQGQETAEFWKFVGGPPVNMEVKVSGQQGLCCFGHLMHSGWLVYAFQCSRIQSVNVFWWDGESSVLGMPLQEMFLRVWTIRLFPWTGIVLGMNNHFDKKPPCLFLFLPSETFTWIFVPSNQPQEGNEALQRHLIYAAEWNNSVCFTKWTHNHYHVCLSFCSGWFCQSD